MNIIRTGLELSRTFRNVHRVKEIVSILAKNGFDELLSKTTLHQKIPGFVIPKSTLNGHLNHQNLSRSQAIGFRLRKSFEELGPGFIKLGQMLATQEHIFDQDFIQELKLLQDRAKPIPFQEALEILQGSLQCHYTEVFEEIDPVAIGTASIGVVYKGRLKTGEDIVVKIRRPGISEHIESDFEILQFIVRQMEKFNPDIKYLGISGAVSQISQNLLSELDFNLEAVNLKRLKNIFAKYDTDGLIEVPKIYDCWSSESVCVMDFLEGLPFKDADTTSFASPKTHATIVSAAEVFIKAMFIDGFFHGDLHGGNLLLVSPTKIGILDFGLCGSLSKQSRIGLVAIFYAIINGNFENLTYELLEKAEFDEIPNVNQLIVDIKNAISPYIGLRTQQINSGLFLKGLVKTLGAHKICLPQEWLMVLKTIVLLDGVGKSLAIDVDILGLVRKNIGELTGSFLSKEDLSEEGLWIARDLFSSFRILPRYLKWFLRDFGNKNFGVEIIHTGHEKAISRLSAAVTFVGYSMMASVLFLGGMYAFYQSPRGSESIPLLSGICWSLAILFVTVGTFRSYRAKAQ